MSWFKVSDYLLDFRTQNKFLGSIDAAELTVKKIMQDYKPPYRLMVSGGVDSQTMLWSWKKFGKDFIPTSIVYKDQYNEHDIKSLREFARQENIQVEYVEFDLLDFYSSKFHSVAERFRCTSPQFATHLGFIEDLDGTIIFSGDRLLRNQAILDHRNICLYRASLEFNIVPYFFLYTPEIAYSMIYEMRNMFFTAISTEDIYKEKIDILHRNGFPVIAQEKKFNGFEAVKEYYQQTHRHVITPLLKLKFKTSDKLLEPVVYDLMFRHPYELKFGTPKYKNLINVVTDETRQKFITAEF